MAEDKATGQSRIDDIEQLVRRYYDYGFFNGSLLVAEGGEVIFKKGYGFANMEWQLPNTPDTKFRIASITKGFTAMLVLQLVEQGKLTLEGKITDYLPDYRRDTGDKITLHQLLNHTSGIPDYTSKPGFFPANSRHFIAVEDFIAQHCSDDLAFEPGSEFAYSNSGYHILGGIIEKVTGQTYEQVLKTQILLPAGMNQSGYDKSNDILPKRAAGYEKSLPGYENAEYVDMSLPYAAGSLYSTVEDLYRWDRILYSDKLLSEPYMKMLFKRGERDYGYGWKHFIQPMAVGDDVKMIYHQGGIMGFSSIYLRMPDDNRAIVILHNGGADGPLSEMATEITNILYDNPFNWPKKSAIAEIAQMLLDGDTQQALSHFRHLHQTAQDKYNFHPIALNVLGYRLLNKGEKEKAIKVLALNLELYPDDAQTQEMLKQLQDGKK